MTDAIAHEELLRQYVRCLDWALAKAEEFAALERASLERQLGGDVARAEEVMQESQPLPALNPYVLGAIREYWLACVRLNEQDSKHAVEPSEFVSTWLRRVRPDLAEAISQLPYWPIGQDEKGRWV